MSLRLFVTRFVSVHGFNGIPDVCVCAREILADSRTCYIYIYAIYVYAIYIFMLSISKYAIYIQYTCLYETSATIQRRPRPHRTYIQTSQNIYSMYASQPEFFCVVAPTCRGACWRSITLLRLSASKVLLRLYKSYEIMVKSWKATRSSLLCFTDVCVCVCVCVIHTHTRP